MNIKLLEYCHAICFTVSVLLLSGCAHSRLTMELSIYKEDPTFKNIITAVDLIPKNEFLSSVEVNKANISKSRKKLARELFETYKMYWRVTQTAGLKLKGKMYTESKLNEDLGLLAKYLSEYSKEIDEINNDLDQSVKVARFAMQRLEKVIPDSAASINSSSREYNDERVKQQKLREELNITLYDVSLNYERLASYVDSKFYKSLRWDVVKAYLSKEEIKSLIDDESYDTLYNRVIELGNAIVINKANAIEIVASLKDDFNELVSDADIYSFPALMALNPKVYKLSEREESKQLRAFDLLNSQLERLQDPGSSYWRVVTDPKNEDKWNAEFNRTHFYAAGKSGVVIVRDSPMDYRIQEAANNPAALVQAQLQVSRSVANAAIKIASASMGNPLNSLSVGSDTENNNAESKNINLVSRLAKTDKENQIRMLTIKGLTLLLRNKVDQLKDLDPTNVSDADNIRQIVKQTSVLLESRKPYFPTVSK